MRVLTEGQSLDIGRIWQKAASFFGFIGQNYDFAAAMGQTTTKALSLFVDSSTGSDGNTGTAASPFLTIQAALDSLPKRICHPVTITVSGTGLTGAITSGLTFDAADPLVGAWLIVQGTSAVATLASGLTSGTVASATAGSGVTFGTGTVTGAAWTVDDLKGKWIEILAGTGAGQIKVIASNTATVITIVGGWTAPTGATFRIIDQVTSVSVGKPIPLSITEAGLAPTMRGFQVYNCVSNVRSNLDDTAQIVFRRFLFESVASFSRAFETNSPAAVISIEQVKSNTPTMTLLNSGGTKVFLRQNVFTNPSGTSGSFVRATQANAPSTIRATGNYIQQRANTTISVFFNGTYNALGDLYEMIGTTGNFYSTDGRSNPVSMVVSSCQFTFSGASTRMIANNSSASWPICPTGFNFVSCSFTGDGGTLFALRGPLTLDMNGCSGSGMAGIVALTQGAKFRIDAASTITSTTDITVEGVGSTLAAMRANSPKTFPTTPNIYGTLAFE